jgi:hypothetical protein
MTTEKPVRRHRGFGEDARPVLTVGQMLEQFDSRAFGAMLLVFGLLNCLPLPPGSSTILSLPILLLAPQIAWGRHSLAAAQADRQAAEARRPARTVP